MVEDGAVLVAEVVVDGYDCVMLISSMKIGRAGW